MIHRSTRRRNKTMQGEPSVSIIIVSWNSKTLLDTCLTSLKHTAYANYRVAVVDNGSTDGSVLFMKKCFPWVDILPLNKNYGFSVGNNAGIEYVLAKHDPQYVLLLNSDTKIMQPEWLKRMVSVAESDFAVGVVGAKLIYPDGRTQYIGTRITVAGLTWINPSAQRNLPEVYDVFSVLGACLLIKRVVLDRIGVLDSGFSPFQNEESDFCARAQKAGFRITMVSSVAVAHFGGSSMNRVNSFYVLYVWRRNIIRFMLLNFPASWLVKRVPFEIRILAGCFVARNHGGKIPVKLRTGEDLLSAIRVNVLAWMYNLRRLREIAVLRRNRTAKIVQKRL